MPCDDESVRSSAHISFHLDDERFSLAMKSLLLDPLAHLVHADLSAGSAMDTESDCIYAVHVPHGDQQSPNATIGATFSSLKEASKFAKSAQAKAQGEFKHLALQGGRGIRAFLVIRTAKDTLSGARIKRFNNALEASQFVACGSPVMATHCGFASEPGVAFLAVPRVEMNRLKRAIESGDNATFDALVIGNPRFLINTSGDVPTIVQEGPRYNALHIAARAGNEHVVRSVLSLVTDLEQLKRVYGGDNVSDAANRARSDYLLDVYLNTPDKGANETPLHFAAKHGHLAIVRLLLAYPICNRNALNKFSQTPQELICSRGGDSVKTAMMALFVDAYVGLYRALDDSQTAHISQVGPYPPSSIVRAPSTMQCDRSFVPQSPGISDLRLAALAGPFGSAKEAEVFRRRWHNTDRDTKLVDPHKGFERVGRALAVETGVGWVEYWHFLDAMVDLNSVGGLECLERYLRGTRTNLDNSRTPDPSLDPVRKRLRIEEESTGEQFEDAIEDVVDQLALDLSRRTSLDECGEDSDDDDRFVTPPSTPPPVYVTGFESKADMDLAIALNQVAPALIARYPLVQRYLRKIIAVPVEERRHWPGHDSPRSRKPPRQPRFASSFK